MTQLPTKFVKYMSTLIFMQTLIDFPQTLITHKSNHKVIKVRKLANLKPSENFLMVIG